MASSSFHCSHPTHTPQNTDHIICLLHLLICDQKKKDLVERRVSKEKENLNRKILQKNKFSQQRNTFRLCRRERFSRKVKLNLVGGLSFEDFVYEEHFHLQPLQKRKTFFEGLDENEYFVGKTEFKDKKEKKIFRRK